jgi:hypothetical protein
VGIDIPLLPSLYNLFLLLDFLWSVISRNMARQTVNSEIVDFW